MKRFVEGRDRGQATLFPEYLEDWIYEDNPVRAIDALVDKLDLAELGFERMAPEVTGRLSYHPSVLLKLYIFGYLNRVQSSRRLEREAGRNVEVMWLTGRLVPDHKTIADFRKDNGSAIKQVCAKFIELCRRMGLLTKASVAIEGSKFKAVNNRDKNFTRAKVERRRTQLQESVARYLAQSPMEVDMVRLLSTTLAAMLTAVPYLARLQLQLIEPPPLRSGFMYVISSPESLVTTRSPNVSFKFGNELRSI
jgi:transposase